MEFCLDPGWDCTFQPPLKLGVAMWLSSCSRNERGREIYHLCFIYLAGYLWSWTSTCPLARRLISRVTFRDQVSLHWFPESKRRAEVSADLKYLPCDKESNSIFLNLAFVVLSLFLIAA